MVKDEYAYLRRFFTNYTTPFWLAHSYSRITPLYWYDDVTLWPFAPPKPCPMLFLAKHYLARNKLARTLANLAVAAWLSRDGPDGFSDLVRASQVRFSADAECPACNRRRKPPTIEWWPPLAHTAVPMFRDGNVTWFILPTIMCLGGREHWLEPRGITLLSAIYRCPQRIKLRWLGVTDRGRVLAGPTMVDTLLQPEWEGRTKLRAYQTHPNELHLHRLRMRFTPTGSFSVELPPPTETNLRTINGPELCWGQIILGLRPSARKWKLLK